MLDNVKNFSKAIVNTGYNDSATEIVLSAGHGAKLPDPDTANFNVTWWNATDYQDPSDDPNVEIVRVTDKSTDTLTIQRPSAGNSYNGEGSENTAKTHNTPGKTYVIALTLTKKTMDDIDTVLDAEHNSDGTHKNISLPAYSKLNLAEGQMINGKIVPSVASNNLTVALKGMDGNNPSATNPVYVRIGNTIRACTSALSVTLNAGTNWMQLGSAELATKEVDLFVYLGWNATGGNFLFGPGRIPYAKTIADMATVVNGTEEKGIQLSGTASSSSTDQICVVGRFAATLSAGAGYTWSLPTFTASNLIQRPIYETRRLSWLPTYTGFSGSVTTALASYKLKDDEISFEIYAYGTSDNAVLNMTLPFIPTHSADYLCKSCMVVDNGTWGDGVIGFTGSSSTAKVGKTASTIASNQFGGFTTSGNKTVATTEQYRI